MQNKIIISAIFLFFFLTGFSEAADVTKIGLVDFQKIIQNSSAGKEATAQIDKQIKKMKENLETKYKEIEKLKKKFDRELLVMTKEMRDEKERMIRIKLNDLKMLEKKYKAESNEINSKLMLQIQKQLIKIIKNIGKKENYLIILEKNTAGVLYALNSIEITDKIIKTYNDQTAKEKLKKSE